MNRLYYRLSKVCYELNTSLMVTKMKTLYMQGIALATSYNYNIIYNHIETNYNRKYI